MSTASSRIHLLPTLVFLLITGILLLLASLSVPLPIEPVPLLIANLVLFAVTALLVRKQRGHIHHPNPNVFVRGTLGGTLLKMGVVLVGIMAYRFLAPVYFNKFTVLGIMIFYFVYLFTEVYVVTKLARNAANG
jgi:hypothetical protein